MVICFLVTLAFRADVDAQAGAYATGVLTVITSASVAVALAARRKRQRRPILYFGVVSLIFIYTTVVTIIGDPVGLGIALLFIATIVVVSLVSRSLRSTELRASSVTFDDTAMPDLIADESAVKETLAVARTSVPFAVVPCCSDNSMPYKPWMRHLAELGTQAGFAVDEVVLPMEGRARVIVGTPPST